MNLILLNWHDKCTSNNGQEEEESKIEYVWDAINFSSKMMYISICKIMDLEVKAIFDMFDRCIYLRAKSSTLLLTFVIQTFSKKKKKKRKYYSLSIRHTSSPNVLWMKQSNIWHDSFSFPFCRMKEWWCEKKLKRTCNMNEYNKIPTHWHTHGQTNQYTKRI